ncbi:MAG TPA: hypothetical protein VFC12_00530 [Terriglobales bacterium]|nr:hypothetical protein [Terriglobales bacterium]
MAERQPTRIPLLSLMGYSGDYRNRLVMEATKVPWASVTEGE